MTAPLTHESSRQWTEKAKKMMPGGVSSPVRAMHKVGYEPIVMRSGKGPRITDEDGNTYLDHCMAWGPLIHGHAHPATVQALQKRVEDGYLFGTSVAGEVELANRVLPRFPGMEKLRFVNSGTEAAMSAVRLARAATGRDLIVKFDGCYHGHADFLLVQAGSGALTLGIPDCAGVPAAAAALTVSLPYNDSEAIRKAFEQYGSKIAAVLVEPVAGNMGVIPPAEGFLETLRECCTAHGAMLVFDEVITGFRLAPGSAASRFNITPDLTVMGKILGGGLPVGAYGGRSELMDQIAPSGPVYQAGTLSGNPLAMIAGQATLDALTKDAGKQLEEKGKFLADGVRSNIRRHGLAACVNQVGSMFTIFFAAGPMTCLKDTEAADTEKFACFWRGMAESGVYLPPSQFETAFISTVHGEKEIEEFIAITDKVLAAL